MVNNPKIIKRGSLVSVGKYSFEKRNIGDEKELVWKHFMVDNYGIYPVMVVEEVRNNINEDTAEVETEQVKCRWFSWKSMSFRERWFDVAQLSVLDAAIIKAECEDFPFEDSESYTPQLNAKVRLKTYALEQYRDISQDHQKKGYNCQSPVLLIVEIGKPAANGNNTKHKDLVRCMWYNPADDKYDDNLWLHPSVLIKLT